MNRKELTKVFIPEIIVPASANLILNDPSKLDDDLKNMYVLIFSGDERDMWISQGLEFEIQDNTPWWQLDKKDYSMYLRSTETYPLKKNELSFDDFVTNLNQLRKTARDGTLPWYDSKNQAIMALNNLRFEVKEFTNNKATSLVENIHYDTMYNVLEKLTSNFEEYVETYKRG